VVRLGEPTLKEKYIRLNINEIILWYPVGLALDQENCTIDIQGWWIFQELVVLGLPATVIEI